MVEVFGSEMTEGLRRGGCEAEGCVGNGPGDGGTGRAREFVDEWAEEGRVRESFFMLRDLGFVVGGG